MGLRFGKGIVNMTEVRLIDANALIEEICKDCNAIKEKEIGERSNRSMEQEGGRWRFVR